MPLRLVPIDAQHPDTFALLHDPVALFAIDSGSATITKQQMLAAQKVSSASPDWEGITDPGNVRPKSLPEITDESYRLIQNT